MAKRVAISRKEGLKRRCEDYRDHLKDVFEYLLANGLVRSHCSDMVPSCSANQSTLSTARMKKHTAWSVSVEPNWAVRIEHRALCGVQGRTKLVVGGVIRVTDGLLVRQSIAVCILLIPDQTLAASDEYASEDLVVGQPVVVRRFHFDYDPILQRKDRLHCHLQYGGVFRADLVQDENIRYRLYSSLDLPRIPFPPYDLVLAFDVFLKQLRTPLRQLTEEPRWRNLVRKSEQLWLEGYYKEVNHFLGSVNRSGTLYERLCCSTDWIEENM